MAQRLKVYATRIGFHEVIVAAPNQKAALAAWDIRDNLFADGDARVLDDDPEARAAAEGAPGVVFRRLAGGSDPWRPVDQPSARPRVPRLARPKAAAAPAAEPGARARARPAARPKPAPDRSRLDAAERALAKAECAARDEQARIARERQALDRREARAKQALDSARRRLETARRAFVAKGGDAG